MNNILNMEQHTKPNDTDTTYNNNNDPYKMNKIHSNNMEIKDYIEKYPYKCDTKHGHTISNVEFLSTNMDEDPLVKLLAQLPEQSKLAAKAMG